MKINHISCCTLASLALLLEGDGGGTEGGKLTRSPSCACTPADGPNSPACYSPWLNCQKKIYIYMYIINNNKMANNNKKYFNILAIIIIIII